MEKLAGDKQIPETGELFSTIGLHFVYQLYVQLDRTVDGHIGTPGVRALRRVEEAPRRDGDRVPNPDHQVAGNCSGSSYSHKSCLTKQCPGRSCLYNIV